MSRPIIALSSGAVFDFRAPECSPWTIDDIARGLANTARFRGQTRAYYSVAQHSILMSREAPPELAAAALFHDAAEAFMGDMPTPLKAMLSDYRMLEEAVQASISRRLGLPPDGLAGVKLLDRRMLATEVRDLFAHPSVELSATLSELPFEQHIVPWAPKRAHWEFHKRAVEVLGSVKYRRINRDSRERRKVAGALA